MRTGTTKTITTAAAVLGLLLVACGDDSELEAAATDSTEDAAGPDPDEGAEAVGTADEDDTQQDEVAEEEAADAGAPAGGTAVVTIGDERYETNDLECPDVISGIQFAGDAEGPQDNARIHGRFASSLPELVGVWFARGDEGEWAAVAGSEVLDRGALEHYTFDENAGTFSGTATFIWVEGAGIQDPDSLTEGTFEVACG